MRRCAFYSSVALLAFGILLVFQNVSAQQVAKTVSIKTQDKAQYEIPCTDKNLRLVWSGLKNEFTDESTEYLTEIGVKNCRDLFEVEKIVDLNGDKQPEIIVHQMGADCPASGNCTFWVFQKTKNNYRTILNADEIQLFELKKTQTRGFTDIELRTHNSATSHYYQLFKFNGEKYTPQKCWWEEYSVPDKKGNFHIVKKPQIRFEKCGKYDYVK